jgi:hypothetical protein
MSPKKTIVGVTEVTVEAPLVDGARAWAHELGVFSTYENAASFVRKRTMDDGDEDDAGIRYFVLDEKMLDMARLDDMGDTTILGDAGSVRGVIHGAGETPWAGRDPGTCRFTLGQLVGFVDGDRYRVGVVNGLPPSPREADEWNGVTLADDLYLIGTLDGDGSPETNDHEHVSEAALFAVGHDVAPEVREALKKRHER